MTSALNAPETEFPLQVDYVHGVRGHVVLAVGAERDGEEALAVWSLGPTGKAGAAWILRFDTLQQSRIRIKRIMRLIQGNCLIDWIPERPLSILARLDTLLPDDLVDGLRNHVLAIPDLLEEIAEHRRAYAEAVGAYQAITKSKLAPMVWSSVIPEAQTLADWSTRLHTTIAPSPVAGQALALTAAVARTAELWQDTEQPRNRRPYLRSFGDPQSLPPRWLARLRAANTSAETTAK